MKENFVDLGERDLKNISRPVRVYRLDLTPKAKTVSEAPRPMSAPPDKPSIAVFIAYLFVGGVGKANAARLGDAFDSRAAILTPCPRMSSPLNSRCGRAAYGA